MAIMTMPLPEQLFFPLQQRAAQKLQPLVQVGDHVLKDQIIARSLLPYPLTLHASSSGTIVSIEKQIILQVDKQEKTLASVRSQPENWQHTLAQSGLVGLGGALFPTAHKWQKTNHTLVINAVECEPFIECDATLMQQPCEHLIKDIRWFARLAQLKQVYLVIEQDNQALEQAWLPHCRQYQITVVRVPKSYPNGSEQQVVAAATGLLIPVTERPSEHGIICQNIATVAAMMAALRQQQPLTHRLVTFAGEGLGRSATWQVALGTPIDFCLIHLGHQPHQRFRYSQGGDKMPVVLKSLSQSIQANSNCILVQPIKITLPSLPCIRCGDCHDVCPIDLLPQQLHWASKANDFARLQRYQLSACTECGCCDEVCPSHIPLVAQFQQSKKAWRQNQEEQLSATAAKERHQQRQQRLEKKQAELQSQRQQRRQQIGKKQAILAAVARAKEKKNGPE